MTYIMQKSRRMRGIIGCMLFLSSVTSEIYIANLFPLTHSSNTHMVYTNVFVNTSSTALTTIAHGPNTIQEPGAFNFSISRGFASASGKFKISVTDTAEVFIEVRELRQLYYFNIAPVMNLGKEYILIASSNRINNYMCQISSDSSHDVILDIRLPPRLKQDVNINGSCIKNSHCILKTDKYIQIQSRLPLYQTVVASFETLAVFCKDTTIFQVLPKHNCGKYFQVSCGRFQPPSVNSNCTIKINTIVSKRQNITINGRAFSVVDFVEFNLERQMLLSIQTEYEVCILLVDSFRDNSGNNVVKTKMLSSLTIPSSSLSNTDYTSASLEYFAPTLKSMLLPTNQTLGRLNSTTALRIPIIASKTICNCICKKLNTTLSFTKYPNVKIDEVLVELRINKSELSSEVRKKSCAKDNRASAQRIGYVGAVVITSVLATIALFDLINLFEKYLHRRKV